MHKGFYLHRFQVSRIGRETPAFWTNLTLKKKFFLAPAFCKKSPASPAKREFPDNRRIFEVFKRKAVFSPAFSEFYTQIFYSPAFFDGKRGYLPQNGKILIFKLYYCIVL